jgi:hypothetical protein
MDYMSFVRGLYVFIFMGGELRKRDLFMGNVGMEREERWI